MDKVSAPEEIDDMCPNCVTPWKCNGPHEPSGSPRCCADFRVDVNQYGGTATTHSPGCRVLTPAKSRPWTGGPWKTDGDEVWSEHPEHVHEAYPVVPSGEILNKANARLISAAPELFDSLEETFKVAFIFLGTLKKTDPLWADVDDILDRAGGALAKARGDR